VVNALFLQTGPHPAPIFANRAPASAGNAPAMMLPRPRPAGIKANLSMPNMPSMPAAPDPIAELLASSQRVIALQRALSDYGYGQIRPTGSYDPATRAAIQEFERNRRLPVTGQISERVTRELAATTGRPLE
jgi:peptidoglycan hydrolase-like protein with peptidoglycan-binding domain